MCYLQEKGLVYGVPEGWLYILGSRSVFGLRCVGPDRYVQREVLLSEAYSVQLTEPPSTHLLYKNVNKTVQHKMDLICGHWIRGSSAAAAKALIMALVPPYVSLMY